MSENIASYFNKAEENRIIDAIQAAEAQTSGELRVHVSHKKDADALKTTQELFNELRMFNTRHRNGVLIHISIASKAFAIYGDKGINKVVPNNFWETTRNIIQEHFVNGNMVEGICAGIESVGEQLKEHFPWQTDDINELPDEITYD
ncbi:TPM domain-containing protein [Weeksellaceae bacterium KMM 9724]|uniref:TPM domain-containing protein n=1 Tax=Profundicola chukchiensis TaxID=2961959 RepID=UPI00243911D9|nr:TPM domain-containing protein [Profundicola chukchiensis]MDG4950386.1 TPM domain-containing protein [Profundicola chukchiensis]